jgi:hypothetical protein
MRALKLAFASVLVVSGLAAAFLAVARAATSMKVPPNVLVTQRLVGHTFAIEGSVGYARILDRSGKRIAQGDFAQEPQLLFSLAPGRYRLVSYQRLCDGNCGSLSAPVDICTKRFRVRASRRVSATIRVAPGSDCRIRVRYG